MQERVLLRGQIERQSTERRSDADTTIRTLGAALCAYGQPTASAPGQREIWVALTLRLLRKPYRSRKSYNRWSSPTQ